MNEPIEDSDIPENDKNIEDSLRNLNPRAPLLDWAAIHSAQSTDSSYDAVMTSRPFSLLLSAKPTVTWLSGIALGAAITFLIMHWFVLTDLRAKIKVLEQSAAENTKSSNSVLMAKEANISGDRNVYDLKEILESSNLTPASYRGGRDRRLQTKPSDSPTELSKKEVSSVSPLLLNKNNETNDDSELNSEATVKNQWRLLKELEPKID